MCPKESMFQQDMEHILDVVGSRGSTARFVGRLDLALCNLVYHLSVVQPVDKNENKVVKLLDVQI